MWVTAFDEVADSILGVSVKKFSTLDDDGRKRVAWGVSGMIYYMTVEKTQGTYKLYHREYGTCRILPLNYNVKAVSI